MKQWLFALSCVVLVLAIFVAVLTIQVRFLTGQVHQDRTTYVQQEHNDRAAVRGLGRALPGIARREIRAMLDGRLPR